MARAFSRVTRRGVVTYAASLDAGERAVIVQILEQVRDLIADDAAPSSPRPAAPQGSTGADSDFEAIVAGLRADPGFDVGSADSLDAPAPPEDSRSFGARDPALQRLFPNGNRADDEASAEFRRLTEQSLRQRKVKHLESAITALREASKRVELPEADAHAFLIALTDVRLVLGERLGLRDDDDVLRLEHELAASVAADDPRLHALAVYDFLSWLQETLAHAMLP